MDGMDDPLQLAESHYAKLRVSRDAAAAQAAALSQEINRLIDQRARLLDEIARLKQAIADETVSGSSKRSAADSRS